MKKAGISGGKACPESGNEGAAFGLDGAEVTVISASWAAGGVREPVGGEETEPRVQTGLQRRLALKIGKD